ncbi:MAG TPA: OFA family MFS transporter [Spirochaetia bacterium]|nr:OFA family MFS transporter [Spirochaetia bacterium]
MAAQSRPANRWLIAAMGTVLMVCLGTVYAWSFFQDLLVRQYKGDFGWSNTEVAWIFSFAILFLGLTAAWGGPRLARIGPRKMAMTGAILFALGYAIAALALAIKSLLLLYLGYGVIGGIGLGLGYVTPVATVSRWFPDRKGLATGMVIMGFGLGALFMSKILAPAFLAMTGGASLVPVFLLLAATFLVLGTGSAWFMENPSGGGTPDAGAAVPARNAVLSRRFVLMWVVFFCNITAGISIISFQSPLLQTLLKGSDPSLSAAALAGFGATLIAVSSLFNGAGRFFWGAVSDRLGRAQTFRIMLGSGVIVFALLAFIGNAWLFAVLACWVLLCYGGGFGSMPAFVGDVFGARLMPAVYGAVLTAWSAGGIVGPQIVAVLKDRVPDKASTLSFIVSGAFVLIGFILSLLLSNAQFESKASRRSA